MNFIQYQLILQRLKSFLKRKFKNKNDVEHFLEKKRIKKRKLQICEDFILSKLGKEINRVFIKLHNQTMDLHYIKTMKFYLHCHRYTIVIFRIHGANSNLI